MSAFTASDWVYFALAVGSFLLAGLSIVFVVITVRQNNRMIKASTRAYVNVQIVTSYDHAWFLWKNYGNSAAVITSFKVDVDLSKCAFTEQHTPFENAVGTHLAPHESILSAFIGPLLFSSEKEITFEIGYKCNVGEYLEKTTINLQSITDHFATRRTVNTKNVDIETVKALQDIHEQLLKI